ncbi:MAG TPA: NUDIX domain-containing protein [Solirubrobacterales bacterium]|nr:NUDIX domain-containing protein [Solirubrobacterales bacterium]
MDVHVILRRGDQVLLGLRLNTGYEDGKFHLPAGHLEAGESVATAAQREAFEELGVTLETSALQLSHVMHRQAGGGRMAVFFSATDWQGEPRNCEPEKCAELRWFPLVSLPANLVPYAREALMASEAGSALSLDGWTLRPAERYDRRGERAA